jgi:hypothetical protein
MILEIRVMDEKLNTDLRSFSVTWNLSGHRYAFVVAGRHYMPTKSPHSQSDYIPLKNGENLL